MPRLTVHHDAPALPPKMIKVSYQRSDKEWPHHKNVNVITTANPNQNTLKTNKARRAPGKNESWPESIITITPYRRLRYID